MNGYYYIVFVPPSVNAGHEPGADLGPVISPESKQRILDLVESGVQQGADLVLDGRDVVVPG